MWGLHPREDPEAESRGELSPRDSRTTHQQEEVGPPGAASQRPSFCLHPRALLLCLKAGGHPSLLPNPGPGLFWPLDSFSA